MNMELCKRSLIAAGAAFLAGAAVFQAGCEVDSASATIYITPDSAALSHKGQSVTLTCMGGYECNWHLETETWGSLNTRRGAQVVYTSYYHPAGDVPVVQVVTVASKFNPVSGYDNAAQLAAATNIPITNIQYATAYITHMPTGSTNIVQ